MNDALRARPRGSILLLALWTLFLLSFFSAVIGGMMRQKLELVRRLGARESFLAAADCAVQKALAAARGEEAVQAQGLSGGWSSDPALFQDIDTGVCTVSVSHAVAAGDGSAVLYGLEDEEGKININRASQQVLERLFRLCGLDETAAQNLANSVVDWRDNDDFLSVPTGSAESSYYRSLPHPYETKNADFEALDELLLVKGMDENFFKIVRNYITIYGNGAVNVNTASVVVLRALGLGEDTVGLLVEYRNGKDGAAATADDNVFLSAAGVLPALTAVYHLSDAELKELSNSAGLIGVASRYFTVHARVQMKRGRGGGEAAVVIDTKGNIRSWEES